MTMVSTHSTSAVDSMYSDMYTCGAFCTIKVRVASTAFMRRQSDRSGQADRRLIWPVSSNIMFQLLPG